MIALMTCCFVYLDDGWQGSIELGGRLFPIKIIYKKFRGKFGISDDISEYWQNIYSVFVRDRGWIVLQEFLIIRVI